MAKEFHINKLRRLQVDEVPITGRDKHAWTACRSKFLWIAPGFGHVLYTMMANEADKLATFTKDIDVAATDGERIFINPETFFANYNLDEQCFITGHEVLHGVLDHPNQLYNMMERGFVQYADGTKLPIDKKLLGISADYVVNAILVEGNIGTLPKDAYYDPKIATTGDTMVDVYRKLYEDQQKGKPTPQGNDFDEILEPGTGTGTAPNEAVAERNDAEWKSAVAAGMAQAKAQGKLPANIERLLTEELQPIISWEEHIFGWFAKKIGAGSYSWRTPNRHMLVRDEQIYSPGRMGNGANIVVVGADTSGSINDETIAMYMGELSGMIETLRPKRIVLVWCDAEVNRVDEIEDPSDLGLIRAKGAVGGGGTDFRPVFDLIDEMGIGDDVDALVYLTDLYGPFPSEAPKYPVLWGCINDQKAPFGETIHIPQQAEGTR